MVRSEVTGTGSDETGRYARLASHLAEQGYVPVAPPVLQPIEPFLELSGEDIRRRIFVTQDRFGAELCLRPEFTIPVCRYHQSTRPDESADYSYQGPVFRLTAGEPEEFAQAGVESIGRQDTPAADAETLGLALEGLKQLGCDSTQYVISLGDMGLTSALLDALEVPFIVKRRTLQAIATRRSLIELTNETQDNDPYVGLLATIEGQDPKGARAFVEDILSIAGISTVGGRTATDIAERFLAKAAARAHGGPGLNKENGAILNEYCSITGDPDTASASIKALVHRADLRHPKLDEALSLFDERIGFMAARGLPIDRFTFRGGFARNLDYYTGFIFEIARQVEGPTLVGGGRYDGLLEHFGKALPAVGCTFWLERCTSGA